MREVRGERRGGEGRGREKGRGRGEGERKGEGVCGRQIRTKTFKRIRYVKYL